MRRNAERGDGIADRLVAGLGDAVADIRTKLLDEAWFGRRTTSPGEASSLGWEQPPTVRAAADTMPRRSFEETWATRVPDQGRDVADTEQEFER